MLTYGEAERVLAWTCDASLTATTTFRAKLKQLKKLGIPLGIRPGQGRKILYAKEEIFQWALCLELLQFGIDPSLVASWISEDWRKLLAWIHESEPDRWKRDRDLFLCFEPQFVSEASIGSEKRWPKIGPYNRQEVSTRLASPHLNRLAVINFSETIRIIERAAERYANKKLVT